MKAKIVVGDIRRFRGAENASRFQAIVTSPPYWGMRSYATARWHGGDPQCDHVPLTEEGERAARSFVDDGECGRCGAICLDDQIGVERRYESYIETMVGVFRELRMALKDDGVLWLNIGDTYQGSWGGYSHRGQNSENAKTESFHRDTVETMDGRRPPTTLPQTGLKDKDMALIPERLALAMQADGWYVRNRIVWAKPNGMQESVRDRFARTTETIWMMTKQAQYFFNGEPIAADCSLKRADVGSAQGEMFEVEEKKVAKKPSDVWIVPTSNYRSSHTATMPTELVRRFVLASTREGDLVFDPFTGAGTTGYVATGMGRNFEGWELSADYAAEARQRIGMWAEIENLSQEA